MSFYIHLSFYIIIIFRSKSPPFLENINLNSILNIILETNDVFFVDQ